MRTARGSGHAALESTQQATQQAAPRSHWRHALSALTLAAMMVACGGGAESPSTETPAGTGGASGGTGAGTGGDASGGTGGAGGGAASGSVEKPATRADASRFLTQSTFGPKDADIDRLIAIGYAAWIDEQFAKPASSHRDGFDAVEAAFKAATGNSTWDHGTINTWWKHALSGDDQLRQRVAYAWSQIMVISLQDSTVGGNPRAASIWLDMLADKGLGNYRDLLESVSLHPLMGSYLSHLQNRKADPRTGRVPDENFAREIMQLFSIGLHELNADGTRKLAGGLPIDTYASKDISGLAKVFTGFSWGCTDIWNDRCFYSGTADGAWKPNWIDPMMGYWQFHSTDEKSFLGRVIAAKQASDPQDDLKTALDTLSAHPNVGPFIGKQLIQRLVTSNPSSAYVQAVAAVFDNNGAGVRGDLKAVVKAILMHPEARVMNTQSGKVREPVLRMTAYLRAFDHQSASGFYQVNKTDNPGTSLGQAPLVAPSVFNFYRPGYAAPGTLSAAAGLVAPELQIAHETSAAGYVNYLRDAIDWDVGWDGIGRRADLKPDWAPYVALHDKPGELVDLMNTKLMYGTMPADLKAEIVAAVSSVQIPALAANGSNQSWVDQLKLRRVKIAVFLTMVSPEFQVQR
jgi:uncharacterized protein (DUF1800 family)